MNKCVLLALRHFFLFRARVFSRALGSVARREPARTPYASVGPSQGPWHVLWEFEVASSLGEGFRARRAIYAHANPRTWYLWYILTWIKKIMRYLWSSMSMMSPDVSWWWKGTQQDCTSMILRPSSHAKFIQPTTQPEQTNPQSNPDTTLLRTRNILLSIFIGQHKK